MPKVIRDMGLASFDKAHEPPDVSTMGHRIAINTFRKLYNRVPDMVCDLGAVGKEPLIRLLAHRAVNAAGEVVEKYIAGQDRKSKGQGLLQAL